jgi:hypothetical protein
MVYGHGVFGLGVLMGPAASFFLAFRAAGGPYEAFTLAWFEAVMFVAILFLPLSFPGALMTGYSCGWAMAVFLRLERPKRF